ncbi:hypothetical protein SAMN05878276_3507 [Aquipseudomonas alcaligenes]|uniref:ATP-binding protein n=1 Tax=Aquipseudomonas alcaligenes TaxID=43263 RepID=UPI000955515F|nr:ATP-binding protein [Pseudomonas alcaligenes]SIS21849.1 hypothetical protein SAMN05878276_3507 [Pseudomonas alcaligenes]
MDSLLNSFLQRADAVLQRLEPLLPAERVTLDWQTVIAARWQREGRTGYLQPLRVSLDLSLDDLVGVDTQREQLSRNTQQFVAGLPANHALLWGARGTGKSSLVRALLAAHADAGLRLIEIERDHLADLPRVVEALAGLPQRFVLFCDDLSFESGEGDYRVLKSVLDGSLERAPDNVLLYATSNRRHLVPEKESDNDNWQRVEGELHPSEAVEDKIALSDRFGLWISFYPFTQDHFLAVVRHWITSLAEPAGLQWNWSHELEILAIRWALGRGNRNGRCAYQFARSWVGQRLLEVQP